MAETSTRCIAEPIPELDAAAATLERAASLLTMGDLQDARSLIDAIDTAPLWAYRELRKDRRRGLAAEPGLRRSQDCKPVSTKLEFAIFERDGWACRYCGIRVLDRTVPRHFNRLPGPPLWTGRTNPPGERHIAIHLLWGTVDHVRPKTRFATDAEANAAKNLVTSCNVCNYGKEEHSLEALRLLDPFDFEPAIHPGWDGLITYFPRTKS